MINRFFSTRLFYLIWWASIKEKTNLTCKGKIQNRDLSRDQLGQLLVDKTLKKFGRSICLFSREQYFYYPILSKIAHVESENLGHILTKSWSDWHAHVHDCLGCDALCVRISDTQTRIHHRQIYLKFKMSSSKKEKTFKFGFC